MRRSVRRGRRHPAGAHAGAVGTARRLHCAARPEVAPRTRCAHFVRCAQTGAASQFWKRAARADLRPALLVAPEIAPTGCRLPRCHRSTLLDANPKANVGAQPRAKAAGISTSAGATGWASLGLSLLQTARCQDSIGYVDQLGYTKYGVKCEDDPEDETCERCAREQQSVDDESDNDGEPAEEEEAQDTCAARLGATAGSMKFLLCKCCGRNE
jgi:hypothetical protein